jgi:hypothetical protein
MVLSAVVSSAERRGGRVEKQGETDADLVLGSRSSYRIWGMWSTVKSRPLRLHLSVSPEAQDQVRVSADATSDVGSYLVNMTRLSSRQFEKAFDQLFETLRSAATPV